MDFMNHDLVFELKYSPACTFYRCTKCCLILNYIFYSDGDCWWEEVYFNETWMTKIKRFNLKNITCDEILIKNLLE